MEDIVKDWVDKILDNDELEDLVKEISVIKNKDFANFMKVINKHLGQNNLDGEFDGLAMELEEYYSSKEN